MGYDCFIFRRDTFVNFALGLACVGAPHVGKILFANQLLNSQRFSVLRDLHLTFHNGNERSWRSRGSQQYADHNKAEFAKLMAELRPGQAAKVRRALRESRSEGLIRKVAAALGLRA